MDSNACLHDMKAVLDRENVPIHFNTKVKSLDTRGGKATGVTLTDGTKVEAGTVVNCAGPWFDKINGPAGVTTR